MNDLPRMTANRVVPFSSGLPIACPCQLPTVCHYCQNNECAQCVHERHPGAIACETWILDRRGRVVIPAHPVWIAGYACRWECACKRQGHRLAPQGALW